MSKLVRLWKRPTNNGQRYTYYLIYYDVDGRRRQKALGHADKRKAERHCAQFERELRMGTVEPESMKLSKFFEDSLERTRGQVRESTLTQYRISMRSFVAVVGDIDYQRVRYKHGEKFVQESLDNGKAPATVNKELRAVKRIFQLAINRGQLEDHPLKLVPLPRVPRANIRVYRNHECQRLLRAAEELQSEQLLRWYLLILSSLCTGMRRGELLNLTWRDIDFEQKTAEVSPKKNTEHTWEWHIKDTDRRKLPLSDELVGLLADHQAEQPEGYPYVFVPPRRYDHIQNVRRQGKWTVQHGQCPLNNFTRHFDKILSCAGIEEGTFHDLRRTCLTNWLANGLGEYNVMTLAGHAEFDTTRKFYLAVGDDLLDRARSVANLLQPVFRGEPGGASSDTSAC